MEKEQAVKIACECLSPLAGKCDQYLIFKAVKSVTAALMEYCLDEEMIAVNKMLQKNEKEQSNEGR